MKRGLFFGNIFARQFNWFLFLLGLTKRSDNSAFIKAGDRLLTLFVKNFDIGKANVVF